MFYRSLFHSWSHEPGAHTHRSSFAQRLLHPLFVLLSRAGQQLRLASLDGRWTFYLWFRVNHTFRPFRFGNKVLSITVSVRYVGLWSSRSWFLLQCSSSSTGVALYFFQPDQVVSCSVLRLILFRFTLSSAKCSTSCTH